MYSDAITLYGEPIEKICEMLAILRTEGCGDPIFTLKRIIQQRDGVVKPLMWSRDLQISVLERQLAAEQQEHLHTAEKLFEVVEELDSVTEELERVGELATGALEDLAGADALVDEYQQAIKIVQTMVGNVDEGTGEDYARLYRRVASAVIGAAPVPPRDDLKQRLDAWAAERKAAVTSNVTTARLDRDLTMF